VVIFKEDTNHKFDPKYIKSNLTHVFVVVEKVPNSDGITRYRVQVTASSTIFPFPPYLPEPPIFQKGKDFQEFFLTKLVNAERRTVSAKKFSTLISRTREQLLTQLIESYTKKKKK